MYLTTILGAFFAVMRACCISAMNNPTQRTTELTAIYNVDQTSSSNGGCARYMGRLRASYVEALDLLGGAIQALTDLQQPQPSEPPPGGDAGAYNEWIRKAQPFLAMFGERIPSDGTLGPKAQRVLNRFVYIRTRHSIGVGQPTRFYVRCNDDYLEYLDPSAKSPLDASITVAEEGYPVGNGQVARFVDGAYYAAGLPAPRNMFWASDMKPRMSHPFCNGNFITKVLFGTYALAWYDAGLITFCNKALDMNAWQLAGLEIKIQSGDSLEKIAGETMTAIWVHEWGHLIFNDDDPTALNAKGRPKKNWRLKTGPAYGWVASAQFAQLPNDRAIALQAPENYMYFALAVHFGEWQFGTGKAKKQVEPLTVLYGPEPRP